MLLLLHFLLIFSGIVASLPLFVSLSDLPTAPRCSTPYLVRLLRRPQLSFLEQPWEFFFPEPMLGKEDRRQSGEGAGEKEKVS